MMKKSILTCSFFIGLLVLTACKKNDDTITPTPITPPVFTAKDEIIGNNFYQVEFSDDSRSMVWCEQSGVTSKVYYADVDLDTGLPNFATKQFIDNIQGQGWPYWGQDNQGSFFLIMNANKEFIVVRRTGTNTLVKTNLGIVNTDAKALINVSHDPTKPYFWINYTVKTTVAGGKDKLYCFRSDKPNDRSFINEEVPNTAGSAYELTFPRWKRNSEILLYPFRGNPNLPIFDIKFWNGQTQTSTQITNDGTGFHHVDDFPFTVAGQEYLFSSKNANKLAICKQQATGFYTEIENYSTPTTISPYTLTSFEPFTINGKTYGAYQVYNGGGIPGFTKGEIWLKGILGETLQTKISTTDGVAVDPEYVIGNNKVWIYYYGKAVGTGTFDLHRCETPLTK